MRHSSVLIAGLLLLQVLQSSCFDNLVNSKSTPEAVALYQKLISFHGKFVLSGQTSFHYNDLVQKVGRHPLIQAFDMQNYSPHNPWYNWQPADDGTVTNAINWYK